VLPRPGPAHPHRQPRHPHPDRPRLPARRRLVADPLPRPLPRRPHPGRRGPRRRLAGTDQPTTPIGADAVTRPGPLLTVRGLSVRVPLPGGRRIAAVTDARFEVAPGECLALIGESGCGKSVLASALLGLLPANTETAGSARLGDLDLLTAGERTLARTVRGRRIGLIPQSPAAHLTPLRTVRSQLEETLAELTGVRGRAALREAAERAAQRAAFPPDHLD